MKDTYFHLYLSWFNARKRMISYLKNLEVGSSMKVFKLSSKNVSFVFVLLLIILLFWPLIPMVFNPMRRPQSLIRRHVLMLTPIGMSMENVLMVIENNDQWGNPSVNYETGFPHPRHNVPGWPVSPLTGISIVGDQSIRVFVEPYRPSNVPILGLFAETRVTIFWGFDENGNLIEVYVRVIHT